MVSVSPRVGTVSALAEIPPSAESVLVLGHGAGAGMRHPFLERLATALAHVGVGTVRYQFPFTEQGRKRPDVPAVLEATVRAVVAAAGLVAGGRPLFAGGKSMGGRMTSRAQATRHLPGVQGMVFFGFPLHPAHAPATERAEHLRDTGIPLLFLQGTRDRLADLSLLGPILNELGSRATLRVIEGADHDFKLPARSGGGAEAMADRLADHTADWVRSVMAGAPPRSAVSA